MARFANGGTVHCFWEKPDPVWISAKCGLDRDCLPADGPEPTFREAYCNGINWTSKHPTRTYDIFLADRRTRIYRVKGTWATREKAEACLRRLKDFERLRDFEANPPDYTINIPGITDILRIPGLETKELRRERFLRMKTSVPALPRVLQWIPPLINKLDDAQDLLFTGLALAWPILRLLGRPFLGPLGILLTVSDLLNLGT
jgi:hypothetical protein